MSAYKTFFYDWVGGNEGLFRIINGLNGDSTYNATMVFLSHLADYHHFPHILMLMAFFGLAEFAVCKLGRKGGAAAILITWIGVISVFSAAYAVDELIVREMKEYFAYPRPYTTLGSQATILDPAEKSGDDYQSFPSRHVSFITVLVASLWPLLAERAKLIGVLLVAAVAWARVAAGMHFPADVLAAMLIGFIVAMLVRSTIYTVFARLFRWKC